MLRLRRAIRCLAKFRTAQALRGYGIVAPDPPGASFDGEFSVPPHGASPKHGMPRPGRLSILMVPLLVGLLGNALPGRAQQATASRYSFADTTLLRDTLNLHFVGIFPMADSLQITPDTLRALMIRYRYTLPRLVHLSDSLHVPVDSVGVVLERERFNPLAGNSGKGDKNDLRYTSGYTINRTSTTWTNGGDMNVQRGAKFLHSVTNVEMDRTDYGSGHTSLRQVRSTTAETGWRLSPSLSLGGRANLERYDNKDLGRVGEADTKSEFQLSSRARRNFGRDVTSELNFFSGYLDQKNTAQVKRGLSSDLNGRLRVSSGTWFTHDLSGQVTGNLAKTRRPDALNELNTRDLSTNLRGVLTLYNASPVGLNVNYGYRKTRVETPLDSLTIQRILNTNNSADATLRMRLDNDRFANVTGSWGHTLAAFGTRDDKGGRGTARWLLRGYAVDANYGDTRSKSNYPRRSRAFGYIEDQTTRSADATITHNFSTKLTGKLNGSIGLTRSRYTVTADSATTPVPRDAYNQSYRADALYNQSERLTSGISLTVSLQRGINITPLSTASNTDTRSYRGEWRWSYRLLPGLTVAQTNQIQADYQFYPFAGSRNTLSLNYNTITNLSAVVTPKFNMEVSHATNRQPRGAYVPSPTGIDALKLSDDTQNFTLRASMTYTPTPALSFSLRPEYYATDRSGSNGTTGDLETQRQDRRLGFSGGVNINKPIGPKAQLTGNIARTFDDSRTRAFTNGLGTYSPRSETDYWNGSLQLTWQL